MDNPARTADFVARRDLRLADLRVVLAEMLHAHPVITLEVGCGHGHFLTAYAAAHPDRFCVGIDIVINRIDRAGRKRDRADLPNLRFIRAEALEFLASLPPSGRLGEIFILFPDPWPKRRHCKNRLIQPKFLDCLAAKAGEGAHLYFRTDYAPYFSKAKETIGANSSWQLDPQAPWPFESPTVFQTRAPSYQSLVARWQRPPKTTR